jgi:hypothetical protein
MWREHWRLLSATRSPGRGILALCQTHQEFTAGTTFVIATLLATAQLKSPILTPKLDKSLRLPQNISRCSLCIYMACLLHGILNFGEHFYHFMTL